MSLAASPDRETGAARAALAARFERLPLSRWHVTVRVVIGVVTFFEAFDQLLIAYAMPELRQEWALSTGGATLVMTVGSVGMLLGALLSGRLADRYGRVTVIAACIGLSGLASAALAATDGPPSFMALRFVQGLAIGGEVPVAATFISEITRSLGRGRFVLLYELVFPAGLTVGALCAAWIVPALGWRWMYLLAALPGLLALLVRRTVPESPRWLADRGRMREAEETMALIERKVEAATGRPLPPVTGPAPASAGDGPVVPATPAERAATGVRGLFTGRYRRRTLVLAALWFTGYFVNYGITSWLPSIYGSRFHLSLGDALLASTVTSVAGLAGCLVAALTVDRIGRRRIFPLFLGGTAATLLVLALTGTGSTGGVLLWTSLAAVCFFGSNICLYLYTPELYPTRMRALGCATGGAVNRLGVIGGPVVVGAVYAASGLPAVFAVLAAVAAAGALAAAFFAEETRDRPLEEVSP
ncbi:MFS transporter [Streptomyces sp. NPDC014733]|uniref:MFS transporter n=1 Tax=Streptomyces sp. NPDC014733 TaxID=3364885 RepID=UPI0036F79E44